VEGLESDTAREDRETPLKNGSNRGGGDGFELKNFNVRGWIREFNGKTQPTRGEWESDMGGPRRKEDKPSGKKVKKGKELE